MFSNLDPQVIAALYGAIFGGLISFITSLFVFLITERNNRNKEIKAKKERYLNWLNGLKAEVKHLLFVIKEISDLLQVPGMNVTKRFNFDYLEKARLIFFEFDGDVEFLSLLTTAYRDIIQTNTMLDWVIAAPQSRSDLLSRAEACINSINGTLSLLSNYIDKKLSMI